MTKPTVVFVPGLWEGPQAYVEVRSLVAQAGYETVAAALVSTGKAYNKDPPSPSMYDDIATIRSTVETLVSADKEVVLVMHSAGGFLGSEAIENMTKAARLKQGREGGVSHLVSVSAALVPEGQEHTPAPFMENDRAGPYMRCKEPRRLLWNDVESDAQAKHLDSLMAPQPAEGWGKTTHFCGWREVLSSYMICERDLVVPAELQEHFAHLSQASFIEKHPVGHMAPMTAPGVVASFILKAITNS